METKFNFNSQICTDRVQSERLLALGFKIETADCYHWQETDRYGDGNGKWHCEILSEYNKDHNEYLYNVYGVDGSDEGFFIPAWSLHRLIEIMPKCVRAHSSEDDSSSLHPYVPKFDYLGVTIENIDEILAEFYQHTDLFDNIIDCIDRLIKEGYFDKEYLI